MTSTKRRRGKNRVARKKAKTQQQQQQQQHQQPTRTVAVHLAPVPLQSETCYHGCMIPSQVHRRIADRTTTAFKEYSMICGAGDLVVRSVQGEFPALVHDDELATWFKSLIVSLGTLELLSPDANDESRHRRSFFFAQAYIRLTNDGAKFKRKFEKLNRDASNDIKRTVVTFFGRRVPCGCLQAMLELEKQQPKQEKCSKCGIQFPSRSLMKCDRCEVALYCSKECQRDEWKRHRPLCDRIGKLDNIDSLELRNEHRLNMQRIHKVFHAMPMINSLMRRDNHNEQH
ncbi:MYND finger domain containing protein [Nitzschia inconspicua]|uniref:MYND finger domain containing protein n=1 Tax=Nitzschia inconspicua TaxID=303405 RepID=A0A9K3KWS5_9STRA|nr:MYND finger domain containing protein [Nitzschia inconspicua]